MAQQIVKPNQAIEVATPSEIAQLLQPRELVSRIRANQTTTLSAAGAGIVEVYTVPTGMKFELRRCAFSLSGNIAVDPVTGAVALNVAGHWVAYLRSGTFIEFAQPMYGSTIQVPGVQTWSSQQGIELRNSEVLEVQVLGLTAAAQLSVYAEGLLSGPRSA